MYRLSTYITVGTLHNNITQLREINKPYTALLCCITVSNNILIYYNSTLLDKRNYNLFFQL